MSTVPTLRLSLDLAQSYLNTADDALIGWHARRTTQMHSYVRDGHEAVQFVDELLRELYRVRRSLVAEIRRDEIDRAGRVDALLARLAAAPDADTYPRDRPTGGALPDDVGGWPAGRAAGTSEGSQG